MKQHLYLLVLGALLSGCGKDKEDAPFVLAGEYESANIIVANPIAMYTKNGEVKNSKLVDNFIQRGRVSSYFFRADVPLPGDVTKKINIGKDGKATIISSDQTRTDSLKAEVTFQSPQYIVVANVDSVGAVANSSPGLSSRCNLLGDKIKTAYPVKHCVPISTVSGTYERYCKWRPLRVIEIKEGKLFLPLFSWLVRSGDMHYNCGLAYSNEFNAFNPAILNQLIDGDTIVVQVREVAMIKK